MARHDLSSIPGSLPSTYYVPESTAGRYLKLIGPRPYVIYQQKVLDELRGRFNLDEKSNTALDRALTFITKLLQVLTQKLDQISKVEIDLCLGKPLNRIEQGIVTSKSEVVHQMDFLERIFKEISVGHIPLTGCELGRAVAKYELPPLLLHLSDIKGFGEIFELERCLNMVPLQQSNSIRAIKNLNFSPNMNEKYTREHARKENFSTRANARKEKRYLYLTNGFEIFYLDLKNNKDQTLRIAEDIPVVPKLATLKLLKERQPFASMGLFKWRSDVYLICGKVQKKLMHEFQSSKRRFDFQPSEKWLYLVQELYKGGSANDIHFFSHSSTISYHSESHIARLNKPKQWPTVENINGQLHLIDSPPIKRRTLIGGWTFSHEVFNPETCSWTAISDPMEDVLHIDRHLVVGTFIFAESPMGLMFESHSAPSYLVFESKKMQWRKVTRKRNFDVWDILNRGGCIITTARCFRAPFVFGNPSRPLYVVIALELIQKEQEEGVHAVAYLVTPKGLVVCFQVLHDFFSGPIWPVDASVANLTEFEDDEGKVTMCSIVFAYAWEDWRYTSNEYVFINTFTVVEFSDAAYKVGRVVEEGLKTWPVELEFVRLEFKDKLIYRMDYNPEEFSSTWPGLQACFL